MTPAVVVSSHTMGLGVIRALGSMGVPVTVAYYDDKDFGYVSKYVNQTVRVSHPERREDQFIDRLIELGQQLEGGVLIPTSDASLAAVSRHKPLLEQHFLVGCTEWEVTRRFL